MKNVRKRKERAAERPEKGNRQISTTAAWVMTGLVLAAFSAVWLLYYNSYAFRTHRPEGAVVCILVYTLLYLKLANVYRAFKIASFPIGETAFAQCLSIGMADMVLYIAACLIARRYVNVLPGLAVAATQMTCAILWATLAKQYFLRHVQPQNCLLVWSAQSADSGSAVSEAFCRKLEHSYGHLFRICQTLPLVEDLNGLEAQIDAYPVIFLFELPLEQRSRIMGYCVSTGKRVYLTPSIEDVISRGYEVKHLIDTPLFSYNGFYKTRQTYLGKRALDVAISLLLLALASPLMLLTALAIKLEDGGEVFFRQARCTQGGKVFQILKFRSMIMNAEKDGKPLPCIAGDNRVTRVGRVIRATRIDELPQLFNVLGGSMTLVGPRPERVEHVELYSRELPEFRYRMRVKAGLTGYAQIYGKYNTTAHDKLLLDLLYIEQQGFLLDVKLVFLTLKTIFTPESTEGFEESKSKAINQKANEEQQMLKV